MQKTFLLCLFCWAVFVHAEDADLLPPPPPLDSTQVPDASSLPPPPPVSPAKSSSLPKRSTAVKVDYASDLVPVIKATSPEWSQPGPKYQAAAGTLRLSVKVSQAGTILDTVGLNGAPAGAFALAMQANGQVVWSVYAPNVQSTVKDSSGWHRLLSDAVTMNEWHVITVKYGKGGTELSVDGKSYALKDFEQPLSGNPLFLGDYPGDKQWEPRYNSKLGFVGDLKGLVLDPAVR